MEDGRQVVVGVVSISRTRVGARRWITFDSIGSAHPCGCDLMVYDATKAGLQSLAPRGVRRKRIRKMSPTNTFQSQHLLNGGATIGLWRPFRGV